ncbi:MAG: penicillin-binding protein 2, partial [Burkholderiales bacterium]|nr:penicillin-binding protein 2 [Burkholderiales bacterium]
GITGSEQVEVDVLGRPVRSLSLTPPIAGNNVELTLDFPLQQIAEVAMADNNGAIVAMDPTNGEILALVSMPGFEPGLFIDGINSTLWNELNTSPNKPLLNRALRGAYPPGSTLKPYLALGALESGKRHAADAINDPGYYVLPGTTFTFRDDKKGGHGRVDMLKAVVESCDTYFYTLAFDTDIDDTARFLAPFGFGQRTGIDIDGEVMGVLPSRAWKRERFSGSAYREDHRRWYKGDSISAGIGQGYNSFTPLQLVQAVSAIATGGAVYRPHLLKRVIESSTGFPTETKPELVRQINLKPENIQFIRQAMTQVNQYGTAARSFWGASYKSAGKTGTAQVFSLKGEKYEQGKLDKRLHDHALYIAYAPVEDPKIAVAIIVENGGFGARAAAPIARIMFDYYLLHKEPEQKQPLPPKTEVDWEE